MQTVDLTNTEQLKTQVESYGFKVVTWQEFLAADDKPEGLLDRALKTRESLIRDRQPISHVIYDPDSDDEGWMLIGAHDYIITETAEDIISMEPQEGPFSVNAT